MKPWHESIPVPPGLDGRIRATVARRRQARWAIATAAAVLLGLFLLRPATQPPPEPPVAFAVSLAAPAPEPMRLQEICVTAEVDTNRNVLVLQFGGPAHD